MPTRMRLVGVKAIGPTEAFAEYEDEEGVPDMDKDLDAVRPHPCGGRILAACL